ncbi:hypothetical protein C7999DRAFT_36248 [Corynascus novoguineensis]|uniref:Uncharacterized protein n=1 Tax=Corynascus novoguineensis TaxID=1126955 RepID=A0AAN7CKP2_9PEZI|nr:hypothetical protein C7999DRAFT_36248 [Corynascus novoguineensis]
MSNAGHSNVGFPNIYESDDQRTHSRSEAEDLRKHTGENILGFMPKDRQREIDRLREEEIRRKQAEKVKKDPTLAATMHGNAPARGAIIDKELQEEDEAVLRKKGDAMAGKKF